MLNRVRRLSRFVTPGTHRKFGVAERRGSIHSFVSVSTMGGGGAARNSVFDNQGFSEAEEGDATGSSRSSSG